MSNLRSLPPLDAIRGFVAVCRRNSISLAARDLCLTQSAVSRQVQALEERLKVPLLIRRHRAIELTDAGERLYQLCAPWLDGLAAYSEQLRHKGSFQPVTVTASIGVTALWLLPRLGGFQAAYPNVDVRVAANNRVLDLQVEGIDLAIRYCRRADAPRGAPMLFCEQVVAVANRPVAERAFSTADGILAEVLLELDDKGRPWLGWSGWLQAKGLSGQKPRAYLHLNQYDQVIQAAIEGHGIALGRVPLVLPMLRDGRLVAHPRGAVEVREYGYFLVDGESSRRDEVRIFRDWILSEVGKDQNLAPLPITSPERLHRNQLLHPI